MLYYIIDGYTFEVMDVASTERLMHEKMDSLCEETGLFIWHVVQAHNRKELDAHLFDVFENGATLARTLGVLSC